MRQSAGGDLSALRRSNQERLLALLLAHGPLHRAGLARRAELSRTTVSTIVGDLMSRGLVVASEEAPTIADRDGRAGDSLAVNPTAAVVVGVNHVFNGTWVHVADLSGRELASAGAELDAGARPAERIATSIEILDRLLAEHRVPRERVVGAGVGVPGPVHAGTGVVGVSLPGQPWSHVHAAEEYDRQLGLPVTLENNTRLEAVAEARWGAGAGARDLLYVGLSQGIASGLILDGRLYRGAVGAAGELGHVSLDVDGAPCGCGNRGCLVLTAGIPAVLAALRPVLGERVALAEVLDRARAGDRAVEGVFADVGGVVGQALANLCNLLNPDRIVIGGELSLVGDVLLEPVRASLRRYALSLVRDVAVVPAGLDVGSRAGALGGAALVLGETPNLVAALNRLAPAGRPA